MERLSAGPWSQSRFLSEGSPGPDSASPSSDAPFCLSLVRSPKERLSVVFYDLLLGAPILAFCGFLVTRIRPSLRKLNYTRSHIMATYYAFLWLVCALNVLRFFVQISQSGDREGRHSWNSMWLLTRFGMVLLEVSVVVFLSQGYLSSGWDALVRTVAISGIFAALDSSLKAIYVFGFKVPLFTPTAKDEGDWQKWSYWTLHALFFLSVYLLLLVLPHTRWRDRLPVRPSFYRYVFILFLLNACSCLGSLLLGFGVDFGYCLFGFTTFSYYTFYPPLLYITFLADFFREEDLQMEDVYYSEMREAGYFDADWE